MGRKTKNATDKFDIRFVLTPDDTDRQIYDLFKTAKEQLGIKNSTDLARLALKRGLEIVIQK